MALSFEGSKPSIPFAAPVTPTPVDAEEFVPTAETVLNPKIPEALSRVERIEAAVGERVNVQGTDIHSLASVIRDGVIVRVQASHWRGAVRLTPAELGITAQDKIGELIRNKNISLGRKTIIEKKYISALTSAAGAARAALYRHSIRTAHGYWIPTHRFAAFKEEFLAAKQVFHGWINKICAQRPSIEEWVRSHFRSLAEKAWPSSGSDWCEERGEVFDPSQVPEKYIEFFVERLVAMIPTDGELLEASLTYHLTVLKAPDSELAAEYATGDKSVNDELKEHMLSQKKALIDDFLTSAQQSLAASVHQMVSSVQERLAGYKAGDEKVHGRLIKRILKTISEVRDLNVINDETIGGALNELELFVAQHKEGTGNRERHTITPEDMRVQLELTASRVATMIDEASVSGDGFDNLD